MPAKGLRRQSCEYLKANRVEGLQVDHWADRLSAYPTFRRSASICFSEPKDALAAGLIVGTSAGFNWLDCAFAKSKIPSWAAAMVMAAVPKKAETTMVDFFGHIVSPTFPSERSSLCRDTTAKGPRALPAVANPHHCAALVHAACCTGTSSSPGEDCIIRGVKRSVRTGPRIEVVRTSTRTTLSNRVSSRRWPAGS